MKRTSMLVVCALCGCGASQEPMSRPKAGRDGPVALRSCHLVKDDGGAVAIFVSAVVSSRSAPQQVDSITFYDDQGSQLSAWDKGVPLTRLAEVEVDEDTVQLSYAANEKAFTWEPTRWPSSAIVVIDGVQARECELAELVGNPGDHDGVMDNPTQLAHHTLNPIVNYGNCRHCVQSFLCGCLNELYGKDPPETTTYCEEAFQPLNDCTQVGKLLFDQNGAGR